MSLKFESHLAILLVASMAVIGANPVNATSAHHITITSTYVHAEGWNSCTKGWYKTSGTFENYCPHCGRHNCLVFGIKDTSEGEWTCKHCDSDYCICGHEKMPSNTMDLIPTTIEPKKTAQAPANFQSPVSGLQKAINCLQFNKTVIGAI